MFGRGAPTEFERARVDSECSLSNGEDRLSELPGPLGSALIEWVCQAAYSRMIQGPFFIAA